MYIYIYTYLTLLLSCPPCRSPQDNLYTVLFRSQEGNDARVVGAIMDFVFAPDDYPRLLSTLADPVRDIYISIYYIYIYIYIYIFLYIICVYLCICIHTSLCGDDDDYPRLLSTLADPVREA
jgi:hypothetical protein